MNRVYKYLILAGVVLLIATPVFAQSTKVSVTDAFDDAMGDIRTIGMAAGGLLGGIVGLIGIGRTAYKLSQGDTDAMNSFVMAIIGIALGFLAVLFIS